MSIRYYISHSLDNFTLCMISGCPQLGLMQSLSSRIASRLNLLDSHASSTLTILYSTDCAVMVVTAVAQAQKLPDIKIVSLDWLLESVNEGMVLDEAQYSFTNHTTDKSAPNSQLATGKKRVRAATPEENDTQQITARYPEEDEEPPVKRQKDGQKAKSSSALTVPVDEGCNLACKDAFLTLVSRS